MAFPTRDPKGYYALLGLEAGAGQDAIKSAFRTLAKEWHPDRNASPEAVEQFQRINAAYQVLSDATARAAYDRDGARYARQAAEQAKAYEETAARKTASSRPRAHAHAHAHASESAERPTNKPRRQRGRAAERADDYDVGTAVGFMGCSSCGRVTAQPRYLVFEEVRGRGFRADRIPVQGVFCADCAEKEAIRTSLNTWVNGWWALPLGPIYSIAALTRNLFGGVKPKDANAKLLVQQAKAFLNRGEYDVARAVAEQARAFVYDDQSRKDVDGLLTGLNNRLPKKLRNRWPVFGRAFVLQSAPFAAVFLLVLAIYMVWPVIRGDGLATPGPVATPPLAETPIHAVPSFDIDSLYHTAADKLVLRKAADAKSAAIGTLDRFTTVQPLEAQGKTDWVRVIAPDGVIGYAPTADLAPGPGWRAQRDWCQKNTGGRPDNGTLLKVARGGTHSLEIANRIDRDVLFKLKDLDGKTAASIYIHALGSARIDGIPDGGYSLMYASGAKFSIPCGLFLADMEAMTFPNPEILAATPGANATATAGTSLAVTLHPIGSGDSPAVAASLGAFNTD